jgi:hypothetical protein
MPLLAGVLATLAACNTAYDIGTLDPESGTEDDTTDPQTGMPGQGDTTDPPGAPPDSSSGPTRRIGTLAVDCPYWDTGVVLPHEPKVILLNLVSWLWGGQLDAATVETYLPLLSQGKSGDVHCVARHMLQDYRASHGLKRFYAYWLDVGVFPDDLTVVYSDADLRAIANQTLSNLVDMTLGDGASVPDLLSRGILVDRAVLIASTNGGISPTARGRWLLVTFLCQMVPPPPPGSSVLPLKPVDGNVSFRAHWEQTVNQNPACAACHRLADPLAFTFDAYDRAGRLRTHDSFGHPFDTRGSFMGENGEIAFGNAEEAGKAMGKESRANDCFAQHLLNHLSFGRLGSEPDAALAALNNFASHGRPIAEIVAAAFRVVAETEGLP